MELRARSHATACASKRCDRALSYPERYPGGSSTFSETRKGRIAPTTPITPGEPNEYAVK